MAREDLERQKGMNNLQKAEINWVKTMKADTDKTLQQKLLCLKLDSLSRTGRFSSPRRTRSRGSPISSQRSSRKASPARVSTVEGGGDVARKESRAPGTAKAGAGGHKKSDESHDAMGNKWPKGMWDNTENYWRMIMAEDQFVITPSNYNRQLEVDFRQRPIAVDFAQLTSAREKCLKWINQNREHFTL
jgi:hypothetical protein